MDQDKETRRSPYLGSQENQLKDLRLWVTTQEAAEYSGYDVEHARRLVRDVMTGAVKKGRAWWIDVEKFTVYLGMMLESKDGRARQRPAPSISKDKEDGRLAAGAPVL